MRDNYGGEEVGNEDFYHADYPDAAKRPGLGKRDRIHSAYMLVYVKKSIHDFLCAAPDPYSVNPAMAHRIERLEQLTERKRLRQREKQMRVSVRLCFENDLVRSYSRDLSRSRRSAVLRHLAGEQSSAVEQNRTGFGFHPRQIQAQVSHFAVKSTS